MNFKYLFIILPLLFVVFSTPVFALTGFSVTVSPNSTIINNSLSVNQHFNFTINNSDSTGANITQVNITWPSAFTFVSNTNGTTASNTIQMQNLSTSFWLNATPTGFVTNTTLQYFWFNLTTSTLGAYNFTIVLKDTGGNTNTINVSFEVLGVVISNLNQWPESKEFGNQTITVNCSTRSNSTLGNLGNITIRISNLTWYNQTSAGWNAAVWENINNVTTVSGLYNSTLNVFTLYGNYSDYYKYVLKCEVNNTLFITPNISFLVSLRNLTGYVKDYEGNNLTQANVSIYRFQESVDGPPTETYITSILTGTDGNFSIRNINTTRTCRAPYGFEGTEVLTPQECSGPMFRIKIFYPNSEVSANQTGPNLPPFPRMMIFGSDQTYQCPPGMRCGPPMLNGSIIYTQNATVLNLTAINKTGSPINFGYDVIDQTLGFPIDSNIRASVSSKLLIVPNNRNYTVMFVRDPQSFPDVPNFCGGSNNVMNSTHCPAPPMSNSSLGTLTTGSMINITMNFSYGIYNITGCLNVTGNNSVINITKVIPKLVPWSGFIPPIKAEISSFNISDEDNLNYTDPRCPSYIAYYRLEVMGSSGGINYFVEFYGKNTTDDTGNPGSGLPVAAFQNFTVYVSNISMFNITLRRLAGSYIASGDVNTSKTTVNLYKNSGNKTACTAADNQNCFELSSPHAELRIKDNNIYNGQEFQYIIESFTNGSFSMPFLNTSTVKLSIFEQGTSPIKKTLDLSQSVNNITIYDFNPDKILPNGTREEFNKTSEGMLHNIRFYRSTSTCNVINPPESCALPEANFSGAEFDPMKVMLAGKSNLRLTTPNLTIYFINVDLLASGPPEPDRSESAMSESRGASSLQTAWRFGSMAPRIYDYVFIGIREPTIDTSWSYNMSLPVLFGENLTGSPVWNISAGNTSASVPEDYTDYNATDSAYRDFLTSTGMPCSFTNSSRECYINATETKFWLKIPHFSGVQPTISGTAPAAAAVAAAGGGGAGGGFVSKETTKVTLTRGQATITIPSIAAGKMAYVSINKTEDLAFREINITVVNSVNKIQIDIKKLAVRPASITKSVTGKVYHYINIDKINITDSDISKVKYKFAIDRSWITSNNIDPTTITMYRYTTDWDKLLTTKESETTDEMIFTAESLGLSTFAITGEMIGGTKCPVCPEPTEWSGCVESKQYRTVYSCSAETNYECQSSTETRDCVLPKMEIELPTGKKINILPIILILAVAIFVVAAGYFYWKEGKKKQKI